MKRLLLGLLALISLAGPVSAQTNTSVGVQLAAPAPTSQYVRKSYWRCGREYYYYELAPAAVAAAAPVINNPIGAQNTDNSISYTFNISYSQLPTAQGSSVLGYPGGFNSLADIYGNVDIGANLDMIARITAQQSADASNNLRALGDTVSKIHGEQKDLAAQQIRGQALVASILATAEQTKAQATLAEKLETGSRVKVESTYRVEQGSGKTEIIPDTPAPPAPGNGADNNSSNNLQKIQALFTAKCTACHSAAKKQGGLDLSSVTALTPTQVDRILERVSHADPAKRMPLAADGKPGEPLGLSELKLLYKSTQ